MTAAGIAARGDRRAAFDRLVEAHRSELYAHCYRILGSLHDAEDALQDAFLRAWRGLPGFDGRGSLRGWLYQIATNASLDVARRRSRPPEARPLPDDETGESPRTAGPDAAYERRESVEHVFTVAQQHLPPNQRAALILRDVLGFTTRETAESLDRTPASVNSALQRARATLGTRLADRGRQAGPRGTGDAGTRAIVEAYSDALERGDVDAVVGLANARLQRPGVPSSSSVSGFRNRAGGQAK